MILTVDTSTRAFSLSLFEQDELAHIELQKELSHSQQIVQVCDFLMKRLGRQVSSVQAAYAGLGPGSFTGVRIGLSFVNTLSQILEIPLLGISSLDLLAFDGSTWYNSVVSFIRSRKGEVYTALYEHGVRRGDYLALGREEFREFLRSRAPEHVVAPKEDFNELGEGGLMPGVVHHAFPSSRSLYAVARNRGLAPRKTYLKPIYVREM
jgi:tRNA threonylcarbamoyl adenosine modification protein YeaZ